MLRHAGDRIIPTNTVLTDEKMALLDEAIERRHKQLKRSRGCEQDLFTMEELEHLNALRDFNLANRRTPALR